MVAQKVDTLVNSLRLLVCKKVPEGIDHVLGWGCRIFFTADDKDVLILQRVGSKREGPFVAVRLTVID